MTTAEQIRSLAEAAQSAYERGRAALYRADGEPVYGQAEMRERLSALHTERREACREAQRLAEGEIEAGKAEVQRLENADPTALLSTEEMVSAGARKPFIEDELAAMDADAFASRLAAIRASGDRAGQYVHLAAARNRAAAARSEGRSTAGLQESIASLQDALFGESAGKELAQARESVQDYGNAWTLARRLESGARTAAEQFESRLSYASSQRAR